MELRTLKYFVEIAEQESLTKAALKLHITQPTLSRQIAMLEEETGKKLYIRTNYNIRLTEDGILLKKRAQEIIELESKTLAELADSDNANIKGVVYIGAGETAGVKYLANIMKSLRESHPGIKYRMISGDAEDISDKLDKGLIDFGLFVGKMNLNKYDYIALPDSDRWGVIVRLTDKLAVKNFITPEDLRDRELLFSHQAKSHGEFSDWLGYPIESLNIIGTHNLAFNASIMVREGLGMLVTIEGIISTLTENKLKFIPLKPEIKAGLVLAWRKDSFFTKAARKFLEYFSRQ